MTGVQTCALPICFPVTIDTKASLAKFFVPIVKVPTNIIARAIKGNPVVLLRNIFKAIQT